MEKMGITLKFTETISNEKNGIMYLQPKYYYSFL